MANPSLLQSDWSLGAKPDIPQEKLPRGSCYALTDAWPNLDAPIRKRGGWYRPWVETGAGSYIAGVGFAPFSTGYRVLVITDGEALYSGTYGATTMTSVGTVVNIAHPPVYFHDKVYFLDLDGTAAVREWNGTTLQNAPGSPPTAAVGCVWKDHLVLARTSANPRRVYFSDGGDPATWNTAAPDAGGQTWDMTSNVQGMAVIKGMILVFEEGMTERLRGDIIPGVVGSDMVREQAFSTGCSDPASVASHDDYVVFANSDGIFLTDGSGVVDMSEQSGINREWKNALEGYALTWTIAGAVYRDVYVASVMDGATDKGTFWIDVRRRVAGRLSNIGMTMLATTPIGMVDLAPKFIGADRASTFAADLSSMWTPGSEYRADGDGGEVTWSMETPFYLGKRGLKRIASTFVTYHLTEAGNELLNPEFLVDARFWEAYTSAGSATLTQQADAAFDSDFCGQVAITGSSAGQRALLYKNVRPIIPGEPGQTITISGKGKVTAGTITSLKLYARFLSTFAGTYISSTVIGTQSSPVTNTVYSFSGSTTIPANTVCVGLELEIVLTSGTTATFRGSDFSLSVGRDPTLTVEYKDDLASSTYDTTLGTLAETTTWMSEQLDVNDRAEGFALKITQSGASADTRVYSVESIEQPLEPSRRERA